MIYFTTESSPLNVGLEGFPRITILIFALSISSYLQRIFNACIEFPLFLTPCNRIVRLFINITTVKNDIEVIIENTFNISALI